MTTPKEVVQAWHEALNRGDLEGMAALVTDDVVLQGPRGSTSGAQVVREWFGRAHVRMIPLAYYAREQKVVVEADGEWLDPASGEIAGRQRVATYFIVSGERISHIIRHEQLETALPAAGLGSADRVAYVNP